MISNRKGQSLRSEKGSYRRYAVLSDIRGLNPRPPVVAGRLRNTATTITLSNVIIMVCLQRYITSGRVTRGVTAHFTDIKLLMKP